MSVVRIAGGVTTAAPQRSVLLAWLLAGAGILSQVMFPLTGGGTLPLTVAAVVLLAGASVAHAWVSRGAATALALVGVAGGLGLVAEAVGVATGFPFGGYDYTGTLGPEVLGVPVLVPLAWTMMAWPALLVARVLVRGLVREPGGWRARAATTAVAAWALTAWDVFLDPQMVDAGHWAWDTPAPHLPGVEGIPLTNFAGWLAVAALLTGVLDLVVDCLVDPDLARHRPSLPEVLQRDSVPVTVYLWTYASSVMANAVFFGRPSVALVGALVMGVVAVPLARRAWLARRDLGAGW
ncbi:putative membrane protein [Nocardioides scoriae]|uniref:Putative membrane protein n=1 Tax=Nocardioides scoriae TaxID=642780 RepID=A0A1H1NQ01_9ACTN|nr:carotenoid biosynthesis protein [Nocardioides scoriae]SDS01028.1 putative membrane protein [Nocardioides scoriae]